MSDCTPSDLVNRKLVSLSPGQLQAAKSEVLREWAGSPSVNDISLSLGKLTSLSLQQQLAVQNELLCRILNG